MEKILIYPVTLSHFIHNSRTVLDQQKKEFPSISKGNIFISSHSYLEVYKIALSFKQVKTKPRTFEDIWQDLRGWSFF